MNSKVIKDISQEVVKNISNGVVKSDFEGFEDWKTSGYFKKEYKISKSELDYLVIKCVVERIKIEALGVMFTLYNEEDFLKQKNISEWKKKYGAFYGRF